MKLLLDTDILSELRRPSGDAALKAQIARADPSDLFLSVITLGEITAGITKLPASKKRRELESWLDLTQRHFADRILPITRDIAQRWGELTTRVAQSGRTLHMADGLIAATAFHHGLHILTRNTKDFRPTGVLLHTPWSQ